jgi:hypothetical protein
MRRTRKLGHRRKTKKQRGGFSILLRVTKSDPSGAEKKENIEVPITETTTPRNIFEIYRRENVEAQRRGNNNLFRSNKKTPRFRLKSNQVKPYYWPAVSESDWNVKGKEYVPNKLYYLEYIDRLPEEERVSMVASLDVLRPVLNYCIGRYGGAKVIPGSSAATDNIKKNVNQQFKFHKPPANPIILVDNAFFNPGRYEFYKYLLFEENQPLSRALDLTGRHVKVFQKPAGMPFEINPKVSDIDITAAAKDEYLAEVKNSLEGEDGTVFFNEEDFLEIICVNISVEGLNGYNKTGSFFDLLRSFGERRNGIPVFPAYGFLE